ncbi:class I SAM-dependent methyltransferase [Scytonema sp. NUACC21]
METNYLLHEQAYQNFKKTEGFVGWDATNEDFVRCFNYEWERLFQFEKFPRSGRVLELGCGAGNIGLYLAFKGYEVVGVDIAPTAIEWAIENAKQANIEAIEFRVGDVLRLDEFSDESFDIVLDSHCFHCIIGSDRSKFLQSAYRVLKSGGILSISSMCNEVPDTEQMRKYFNPETRCLMFKRNPKIAIRYIGWSNDIMQEVIQAGYLLQQMEILDPVDNKDLAMLLLVAQKK